MSENPLERTYKHQVHAKVFIEAFTKQHWTSKQIQEYKEYGMERLSGNEIEDRNNELKLRNDFTYFCLRNIEMIASSDDGWITIKNFYSSKLNNVVFINCKIDFLAFYNCKHQVQGSRNSLPTFYFKKCEILSLNYNHCEFNDINIFNNIKPTHIHFSKSTIGNVIIRNSRAGVLNIEHETITNNFSLEKSSIASFNTGKCSMDNLDMRNIFSANEVTISKTTLKDCLIVDCSVLGLGFCDSVLDNLIIGNLYSGNSLIFNSTIIICRIDSFNSSFILSKTNIGQCLLNNCGIPRLRIEHECLIELYVRDSIINLIDFEELTISKGSVFSFSKTMIYVVKMSEFAMLGYLYLRSIRSTWNLIGFNTCDVIFKRLNWEKKLKDILLMYNEYTRQFESITFEQKFVEPTFRISQSSLGKTEFTDCDLAGFNFEYNNSKITEVFISGGTVPDNVVVYDEQDKLTKVEKLQQQKSFFDQLKKVFEGQGDIVRGTKYHARTSGIQMQIIEAEKRKWWFKYFDTEWWVYKLNETSNRHGESWGWAIVFTLGLSAIGFIFYNAALVNPKYELVCAWHTDFLGDWAQFILPTHKTDFMVNNPSSGAVFIDVISRVFIGYGIYQLISAFRKHGKKG